MLESSAYACPRECAAIDSLKRTTWNYFSGSQLCFGLGAVGVLSGVIERRRAKRVFVVTDKKLESIGLVTHIDAAISTTSAESFVFSEGTIEPPSSLVTQAAETANDFCPDLIVALGGGSNMDLAKACGAAMRYDIGVESMCGHDNVPGPTPPLVCVPTTSGTGSEMSHSAVLRDSSTNKKHAILSQYLRPDVAIVDPQLALNCPKTLTAESGIGALTHAIEAYLVTNFFAQREDLTHGLAFEGNHPFGDMLAERAVRLIAENLCRVVEVPDNLAARSGMALAATLAGAAFSTCGGSLCQALEHSISTAYGCGHGIGNGIVLPEVMKFWLPVRAKRLATIAEWMGVDGAASMEPDDAAEAAIVSVREMRQAIGLPCSLGDVGAKREEIDGLAEAAMTLGSSIDLSPRRPDVGDVKGILNASLSVSDSSETNR